MKLICCPLFVATFLTAACVAPHFALADQATSRPADPPISRARIDAGKWYEQKMVEAYISVGDRNAKWDQDAAEAIALTAERLANLPIKTGDAYDRIYELARRAMDAGCKDGLVEYCCARAMRVVRTEDFPINGGKLLRTAITHLQASKYGDFLKCLATADFENYVFRKWKKTPVTIELQEQAMAYVPAVAGDASLPPLALYDLSRQLEDNNLGLGQSRQDVCDVFTKNLSDKRSDAALAPLLLKAQCCTNEARDASRGIGPDPGEESFNEHIGRALQAAEDAVKLDSDNLDAMYWMFRVAFVQKDSANVDKWADAILKADPWNDSIRLWKISYLSPRYAGSLKAVRDWALECRDQAPSASASRLAISSAYYESTGIDPTIFRGLRDLSTIQTPQAWRDFQSAYEPYLRQFPKDYGNRTVYLSYAFWDHQWPTALAQVEALGGHARVEYVGGQAAYDGMVEEIKLRMTRHEAPGAFKDTSADYHQRLFLHYQTLLGDNIRAHAHPNSAYEGDRDAAIAAATLYLSDSLKAQGDEAEIVHARTTAAVAAGCDDPLLIFVDGLLYDDHLKDPTESSTLFDKALVLEKSSYGDDVKCWALACAAAGRLKATPDKGGQRDAGLEMLARSLKLLPALAAMKNVSDDALVTSVADGLAQSDSGARESQYKIARDVLQKLRPGIAPLMLDAHFHQQQAYDLLHAQKKQFYALPQELREQISALMAKVLDSASQAWRLDPDDPAPATFALTTLPLQPALKRDTMENWFRRAIDCDPGNVQALVYKLFWLEPLNYGNKDGGEISEIEDEFFRAEWFNVHFNTRLYIAIPLTEGQMATYMHRTPTHHGPGDYFKDFPDCYDTCERFFGIYLDAFPKDNYARSLYAQIATWAGDWKTAAKEFEQLGDSANLVVFGSRKELGQMRDEVEEQGGN